MLFTSKTILCCLHSKKLLVVVINPWIPFLEFQGTLNQFLKKKVECVSLIFVGPSNSKLAHTLLEIVDMKKTQPFTLMFNLNKQYKK